MCFPLSRVCFTPQIIKFTAPYPVGDGGFHRLNLRPQTDSAVESIKVGKAEYLLPVGSFLTYEWSEVRSSVIVFNRLPLCLIVWCLCWRWRNRCRERLTVWLNVISRMCQFLTVYWMLHFLYHISEMILIPLSSYLLLYPLCSPSFWLVFGTKEKYQLWDFVLTKWLHLLIRLVSLWACPNPAFVVNLSGLIKRDLRSSQPP